VKCATPTTCYRSSSKRASRATPTAAPVTARPSHALKSTRNGLELVEQLLDLMRHAKAEKTRLAATCELWDRVYGRVPAGERPSLFGELTHGGVGELRFEASFGPPRRAPGEEAKDDTIEVEAVVEADSHRVDADGAESDAADAETPDSPEIVE